MSKPTFHCSDCGGTNVFAQTYVNPNTGDHFEGGGGAICHDCGSEDVMIYRSFSALDRQRMEAS